VISSAAATTVVLGLLYSSHKTIHTFVKLSANVLGDAVQLGSVVTSVPKEQHHNQE
jgi:hypothetical protein